MVDQYHLSNPRLIDYTLANANTSGYASGVSGASWTLTATAPTDGVAHPVTILNNSANNKSSISITVVGTDQNGAAQTETITGPAGSATVATTGYFATVTSVTPASTWGADTANIGWSAAASSPWFNINVTAEDVLAVNVDISGTINFSVQQTFDTFQTPSAVRWQNVASSQTADNVWNTTGGATGVRIIVNSYSSGATIRVNFNATAISNSAGNGGGGGGGGGDVNLIEVGGAAIALGQTTASASLPVVLASNQTGVPTTIADGADVTLGAIADAAATAGGTGTVSAKLRRLSAQLPAALGQTTGTGSISMVPASDAAIMGFAYGGTKVAVTRANNTTPYDAGDVVGGAFEFTNMGPSGGRIAIMRYQFEYDVTALPSGATTFFLALYSVTPPSAYTDGATWDLASGDRASFLGLIPLGTPVDLGSTLYIEGQPLQGLAPAQYKLAGTSLFAYCVTTTGYTPAAQTVQQFTLHSVGLGL